MEVESFNDIPSDMVCLTIPAQTYATANFQGSNEHIQNAYKELHKWMEIQNLKRSLDSWHLEIFHSWEDVENIDVELLDTI
ncbi:GyrI-like domain-containing protein [Rossellomorea aquimaris]|uniref:GyrI-like domain-containing protein n=1 Tax=Rossellomorea aquimaris TaxID=189382 RepID=UPI000B1622A3|nr:GyrI-like domain-containing protein [Rossellomorea aquimaris]